MLIYEAAYAIGLRLVDAVRPQRRWSGELWGTRVAFVKLLHARTVAEVAFFDAWAVIFAVLMLHVGLDAVRARTVSFASVGFALAVANVAAGLSLIPIGLGVFEGTITLLTIAAGATPGEAAAGGLLYRGFNDVFMAGFGAMIALATRRRRRPVPGS